jgi:hypothetical protein
MRKTTSLISWLSVSTRSRLNTERITKEKDNVAQQLAICEKDLSISKTYAATIANEKCDIANLDMAWGPTEMSQEVERAP